MESKILALSVSAILGVAMCARSIAAGAPRGTVFVGSRRGTIRMLRDRDKDGIAEEEVHKTDKLTVPNGVAYGGRSLYAADRHQIVVRAGTTTGDATRPFVSLDRILKGILDL